MSSQQTHFGLTVRAGSRNGLRIDRETYARINKRSSTYIRRDQVSSEMWEEFSEFYEDEDHRILTDEWCARQQERALENFDLNMAYFASLDHAEFDAALNESVATQRGMKEVTDLNKWDGVGGIYVMVLDDYRQAYVGVTQSMGGVRERIRQHWSKTKQFDRLLWGSVTESIISIDSFRALDTTRIFAARSSDPWSIEEKLMRTFPKGYLLNRLMGGRAELVGFAHNLGIDVIRTRELQSETASPE